MRAKVMSKPSAGHMALDKFQTIFVTGYGQGIFDQC